MKKDKILILIFVSEIVGKIVDKATMDATYNVFFNINKKFFNINKDLVREFRSS